MEGVGDLHPLLGLERLIGPGVATITAHLQLQSILRDAGVPLRAGEAKEIGDGLIGAGDEAVVAAQPGEVYLYLEGPVSHILLHRLIHLHYQLIRVDPVHDRGLELPIKRDDRRLGLREKGYPGITLGDLCSDGPLATEGVLIIIQSSDTAADAGLDAPLGDRHRDLTSVLLTIAIDEEDILLSQTPKLEAITLSILIDQLSISSYSDSYILLCRGSELRGEVYESTLPLLDERGDDTGRGGILHIDRIGCLAVAVERVPLAISE